MSPGLVNKRRRPHPGVQAGTVAAFSPADITGLVAWYKADALAGSDGDAIATWADASGNSRDLTQATGSKQPLLKKGANGINGVAVVRFDGTDDVMTYLAGADWITGTGLTVFLVRRRIVLARADTCALTLMANGQANDYNNIGSAIIQYENGVSATDFNDYRNASLSTKARPSIDTAYQSTSLYDGSNNTLYRDGAAGTPVASTGSFAVRNLYVGARYTVSAPSNFANADYGEVLIYNVGVSGANRALIEAYLKAKWGTP